MISMRRLAGGAALTALACAMSAAALAQETTGSVRGQVTEASGAPVANATVTVVHVPSGSSATSVTGPEGFYSARGLRVGGPYRVTATTPGGAPAQATVGAIGVGEPARIDLTLGGGAQVEELVVTAASAAAPVNGPSTNFTAGQIEAIPSISRDLKDLARIDPFATVDPTNQDALSFAGTNTRFNQLTVDGVRQNDDFGLNNNGYPTQRSPISLDAIEAVSVSAAPFSVINNGFTGGAINAVTKSGTNRFHGSAFYEYASRKYQGDTIHGVAAGAPFKEKDYGATLGGPIIKDTLFAFVAYDKFEGRFTLDEGPFDLGRFVQIPRITTAAVETFRNAARATYGYDPLSFVQAAPPIVDKKWLAKIDWNITDNHRATFSYQNTLGNSFNGSTSNTFASGNSVTQPAIGLASRDYNKIEELTTYTVQLNSDWTDNFSTELRFNRKETDTQQNPLAGLGVGQTRVTVADLPGVVAGAGSPRIEFGADISRHDNYLNVKVDTVEAIGRYHLGPHEFLFGARTEKDSIFNVFVANSFGSYTFASYADFLARRASGFTLTGAVDPAGGTAPATLGTARKGAAVFDFRLNSLYGEDRLQINDALAVTAGVRVDMYKMSDVPALNVNFISRNGFSNQQNLDGEYVVLPRVSFNWEPRERWRINGGLGLYSATGLNVWLSDPFANTGVIQTNAVCPAGPYFNVDLTKAPAGCTFTPGNGDTNVLNPAFTIPTVWKGALSVGYRFDLGRFGDGWRVQADLLRAVNKDALYWLDLRANPIDAAPDGRPVYARAARGATVGNTIDMMLSNISKGGSRSWAVSLAKDWNGGLLEGLSGRFSYTNTHAKDFNPMTSSIALSSYTRFATRDANRPDEATSDYEIRDRYSFDLAYERRFISDNKTAFHLFAQRRTGLPFSYTFANSATGGVDNDFGNAVSTYSGRQATSNALIYVPTANDPRVVYASGFDLSAFQAFLNASGLSRFAGSIAPRNAFNNPGVTTVDVRISQELPAFFPNGAKVVVYMDVENLGNLLNDKWGVLEQYDFYRGVPVVDVRCSAAGPTGATVSCATPGAQYVYSGAGTNGAFVSPVKPFTVTNSSLWQIKFGVKYKF